MRKYDSMWRDDRLNDWHRDNGFSYPVTGMPFLMVEYDKGEPVGLVNYIRRDMQLPHGLDITGAYRAIGSLESPGVGRLPFLTARYDNHNWSYQLYAHNQEAADLLYQVSPSGVAEGTELEFAKVLYAMRGRTIPNLSRWDIEFSLASWHQPFTDAQNEEAWPGASVSGRRRAFEPEGPSPRNVRIPCTDIDLAVLNQSGELALVVDYKLGDVRVDLKSSSLAVMGDLWNPHHQNVPALVVRYIPQGDTCPAEVKCDQNHEWMFSAYALNAAGMVLLADHGRTELDGTGVWVGLTEDEWRNVLGKARDEG